VNTIGDAMAGEPWHYLLVMTRSSASPPTVAIRIRVKRIVPTLLANPLPILVTDIRGARASLTLRALTPEEQERFIEHASATMSVVELELTPTRKAAEALRALSEGRTPAEVDRAKLPPTLDEHLRVDGIPFMMPLSGLSSGVRTFIEHAYNGLRELVDFALGTVAWRGALGVPPYTYRAGPVEFSMGDSGTWHVLPFDAIADTRRPDFLPNSRHEDVVQALKAGDTEPLGHQLWREAWNLRRATPRSALMIGYAAFETGVKQLIANLAPEAAWLIAEAPSPPVVKILREYLPTLSLKAPASGSHITLDEDLLKRFRIWTERRNELTHGRAVEIEYEELEEFLSLVADLLWAFDYGAGQPWARDHIRPDTMGKINISAAIETAAVARHSE
jgi:hypothetical protein